MNAKIISLIIIVVVSFISFLLWSIITKAENVTILPGNCYYTENLTVCSAIPNTTINATWNISLILDNFFIIEQNYTSCINNLGQTKVENEICQSRLNDINPIANLSRKWEENATICTSQYSKLQSQAESDLAKFLNEKNQNLMFGVVLGFVAGYYLYHKKEETPTETSELPRVF